MEPTSVAAVVAAALFGAFGGAWIARPSKRDRPKDEPGWDRTTPRYDRRYNEDPGDLAR